MGGVEDGDGGVAEGVGPLLFQKMRGIKRLADYLAEKTGLRVSDETVRQLLKKADIVLSRPQHKISSPDPDYQVKKRRLKKPATD